MSRKNPALTWEEPVILKCFQDDNYTSVEIYNEIDEVIGTGHAKRDPDDEVNYDVGLELATARAFNSAATRKQRRADGLVKHADDVAADKASRFDFPQEFVQALLDFLDSITAQEQTDYPLVTITNDNGVVSFSDNVPSDTQHWF